MPEDDEHRDLAGLVLGKLPDDEAERFRAHLAGCAACQEELSGFEAIAAVLGDAAPVLPTPPADLRAGTLAAVRAAAAAGATVTALPTAAAPSAGQPSAEQPPGDGPEATAATPGDGADGADRPTGDGTDGAGVGGATGDGDDDAVVVPLRRRPRPWLRQGLVAAAAALVAVALAVPGTLRLGGGTELRMVADSGGATGRALVTETDLGRDFEVEIEGLEPPPEGSFYELWAVSPEDTEEDPQRVSLGTFTVGAAGTASFEAFTSAPAAQYPVIGVTLEPADGDPSRTGPRILRPLPR